jgi:hypothetical protein
MDRYADAFLAAAALLIREITWGGCAAGATALISLAALRSSSARTSVGTALSRLESVLRIAAKV